MMDKKVRFEFLIEPDLAARVNALAKEPGATKTDIIVKAIKVFLERGIESEFAEQSAMRFDRLSREVESVRHNLGTMQNNLENFRQMGRGTHEILKYLVRLYVALSAHIPMPEGETKDIFHERYEKLADHVNRRLANEEPRPAPPEEGKKT